MLRRVWAQLRQLAVQMARRPELCCGVILLICALILPITYTCGREKIVVAAARTPVRFFPVDVPVLDLFLGQLDEADRIREDADVSVVFYYAPWCAHSITARQHVQQVALRLAAEVQFIAVNCWWHQGRCRKHKNFFQYPHIHLYFRRFGPMDYSGPVTSDYLESFIQRVSRPLTYLPTRAALHTFLTHHQQGVVGYFQFNSSPQPNGYVTFLLSALHMLRRDHQGAVRFAVVTNQAVAEGVSLREDESVYLHRRLNGSLVFPRAQRNFTVQAVCDWVYDNRESVIQWIQPMGTKSYSLEAELKKGPALLTFLPHYPIRANQLLTQVTDVALRYHSCCGSDEGVSTVPRCCQSLLMSGSSSAVTSGKTNICELCVIRSSSSSDLMSAVLPVSHCSLPELHTVLQRYLKQTVSSASCSHVWSSYSPYSQYSACCRTLQNSQRRPLLPDAVTGLHCRTNKTLRFYLLDSQLNWPLAQRLGAHDNRSALPFITIINLRDETHYVLNNTDSLEQFIKSFSVHYSPLHRHLVQHKQQHPQSLIQEVTTDNFLDTVMDSHKDVLLLYYSSWCGFCSALNHVFLRLARLFQGNGALTVARVNAAVNDLPWEFMVDHLPSVLFFPRHRKQMSVKFPENTPVTLPNLLRFILQHSSHTPREETGSGVGSKSLLEAELHTLQQEVFSLQRARERLSQQLAVMWRENRRLMLHTHVLERQNCELQAQSDRLETLYREKTQQLADTVHRLQELADASEELLNENSLLKVLLSALRVRQDTERVRQDTERVRQESETGD
ncbi:thioredoxin domain-containing protein 11 isoform X1 [Xyrauchen texanus]|uniref:thioredoxin domain-containing protein 11 isoform X1 n=1 Tax=Xyrauchen texanus TaxID=154827 RepID=UPI00224218A2|nr:thioredoxin domain-containing protein 11 isoform X1 [Xyrauchen texanus]